MSLLLKNCRSVHNEIYDIFIEKDRITDIGNISCHADKIIDINKKYVIPGLIDCHVHFRDPGLTHKENWKTGSAAAAKGGITTVIDMPNTIPPTFTAETLQQKRECAQRSLINYGFHFGANANDNTNEIAYANNAASTKIFMNNSTGNLLVENRTLLEKIFRSSRIISVHAEGDTIKTAVELAEKYNKKLYICHVSSQKEIEFLRTVKNERIFCEVTPHHLFFNEEHVKRSNGTLNVLPSIKTEEDRLSLWQALNDGIIDTVATDHAPHTLEEKTCKHKICGVPGVETMLPFLLNSYQSQKISLENIIKVCCENPAKIFGIEQRGAIKREYFADITVIDTEISQTIKNENIYSKCRWSPFHNIELTGQAVITIVNGSIVNYYGKINENQGSEVVFNEI